MTTTDQMRKGAEEAKELASKVYGKEWKFISSADKRRGHVDSDGGLTVCFYDPDCDGHKFHHINNFNFIAASRTLVPDLAADNLKLIEALERYEKLIPCGCTPDEQCDFCYEKEQIQTILERK